MREVVILQLDARERELLTLMMCIASSFLASVAHGVPMDSTDAKIVTNVLGRRSELLELSIKLNLDKIEKDPSLLFGIIPEG